jgi:hypothetical protein
LLNIRKYHAEAANGIITPDSSHLTVSGNLSVK